LVASSPVISRSIHSNFVAGLFLSITPAIIHAPVTCYDEVMPRPLKRKLIIIGIFIGLLLLTTGVPLMLRKNVEAPSPSEQSAQSTPATFNKKQYSTDDPSSLWVVVNKKRPLPSTYVPANLATIGSQQLRKDAADQLNVLLADAKNAGQPIPAKANGWQRTPLNTALSFATRRIMRIAPATNTNHGTSATSAKT
jgi:hypothetical protein